MAGHLAFVNTSRKLAVKKITSKTEFSKPPLGKLKLPKGGTYDYLTFFGTHGDCNSSGEPTLLNGLPAADVKALVKSLSGGKLHFSNIVLDCCMTASFIPTFVPLLPSKGEANIICNWGPGSEMIAAHFDKSATLAEAVCAFIDTLTQGIKGITGQKDHEVFIPVALYVHSLKTLFRKGYENLRASFDANPSNDPGDFPDLAAMDKYLKANGVKTLTDCDAATLQWTIKKYCTVKL